MRMLPFFVAAGLAGVASAALAQASGPFTSEDREFLQEGGQGSSYEQQIAQLAIEHATTPAIRDYAKMVVKDHTAANDALKLLAKQYKVDVTMQPDAAQQSRIAHLQALSGTEFDHAYIDDAEAVNLNDLQDEKEEAQSTQNPEIRHYVDHLQTLDTKHEQAAKALNGQPG